jgi:hypothetical protein
LKRQEEHILSNREIMDFDLLTGKKAPFLGFGETIQDSREIEAERHKATDHARQQIRNVFGAKLESPTMTPKELDDIVQELWETGWNPEADNIELFTRDLGLLLTEATLELAGGKLTFRSPDNEAFHWSIFFPDQEVEAFPFHKAYKCLIRTHGETMTFFVIGLGQVLEEYGLVLKPELKARLPKPRFSSEAK